MSADQDEARQLVRSAWVIALKKALTSVASASDELHISEEANGLGDESGSLSWYLQCLSEPRESAIWTGAAIESWANLATSLLMPPHSGATDPEHVDSSCMDILSKTNELWAEELSRRFGFRFKGSAVVRAEKPAGLQPITISITIPGSPHPVRVALGFDEPLFEYLSNQPPVAPCEMPSSISSLHLNLHATLGRLTLPLDSLLKLNIGSIFDIGPSTAGLVDVVANGTVIASGEVMSVKGRYAVKISRITSKTSPGANGVQ